MSCLDIYRYIGLGASAFSLGFSLYALWLSLRNNMRLIKENRELREVCHAQVQEILRLLMILYPNHEDLTSEEN